MSSGIGSALGSALIISDSSYSDSDDAFSWALAVAPNPPLPAVAPNPPLPAVAPNPPLPAVLFIAFFLSLRFSTSSSHKLISVSGYVFSIDFCMDCFKDDLSTINFDFSLSRSMES